MFQYDQESAMKAGGTAKEGGAYVGSITEAVYKRANTGSVGLELSFKSDDGGEFNYLTLWFKKQDNTPIKGGSSVISAILGLTGLNGISDKQTGTDSNGKPIHSAPELFSKRVGLLLQKVWYTKNDGQDGYKFEIRLPFDPQTRQTLKEKVEQTQPAMVDRMLSTLSDKDDRNQGQSQSPSSGGFGQQPAQNQGGGFGQQAPQQNQGQQGSGFDDGFDPFS